MPNEEYETKLPESVLKQQRAAEEAMNKLSAPEEGNTDNVSDPEPVETVVVEKKVEPKPQSSPAIPVAGQDEDTFKHRYDVLRGKYDAETKQLREELIELKSLVKLQEQRLEDVNAKQSEPEVRTNVDDLQDINPDDLESWGSDIKGMAQQMNAMKAIIRDQQILISGLKRAPEAGGEVNSELLNRVENLEAKTRKQTLDEYEATLNRECPDWVRLNTDQGFNDWLDLEDSVSMRVRRDIISDAASNYRGKQVANIFNAYLREVGGNAVEKSDMFSTFPESTGRENFTKAENKGGVDLAQLNRAQDDFVKGRITEEEYDAISAKYQKNLGRR